MYKWFNGYTDENGRYQKGWDENHKGSILRRDVIIEWKLGNRGGDNDWRQPSKKEASDESK